MVAAYQARDGYRGAASACAPRWSLQDSSESSDPTVERPELRALSAAPDRLRRATAWRSCAVQRHAAGLWSSSLERQDAIRVTHDHA